MAKNLNVNLAFTADASQAQRELKALQQSLSQLVSGAALQTPDFKLTQDLENATRAAAQLKIQLNSALDSKTGNLDLTKFSESMKKSGMSLEKYQNQLYQLGPAGEKAFADLTRAITTAEIPLKRSSKLLDNLWTTMKNTARWQLTSSAMHSFMGAVQSAYGYAQKLNASLNDIRIVTGASTDQMAQFAKEANLAAKALSTTTTEYTNASLIYYQQGLSDQEVAKRTAITMQMANVAGQSAEAVSDQMTAVWNNFYDGSKSLEHYADVMTALGAATASSTDEIAEGLNKFAAVADTVGLSYEYAASALATVTATTRQSADVVGTAFKTLFARIQDLELGKTLDDGTTLGSYSEALAKVGVQIKDTSGEMKSMDTILEEMASKWNTLGKSEQIALAQSVAGVRQYTQLIALMDNWHFMEQNLATSKASSGTLQAQADIYAESWEAANKRVQASVETVYSAILNDEFFIDFTNGFANLIDGIKVFIDSLGGVKGVLLAIGSLVTNIFSKQIGMGIEDLAFSIKGFFNPKAIVEQEMLQKKRANEVLISGLKDDGTISGGQSAEAYSQLGTQQMAYIENASRMSEEEQQINQILMDRNRLLADEAIKAGEKLQKTQEQIAVERKSLEIQAKIAAGNNKNKSHGGAKAAEGIPKLQRQVESLTKSYSILTTVGGQLNITKNLAKNSEEFKKLKDNVQNVIIELAGVDKLTTKEEFHKLATALQISDKEAENLYKTLSKSESVDELEMAISDLAVVAGSGSAVAINNLRTALMNCTGDVDQAENMMQDYLAVIRQFGPDSVQASEALNKLQTRVRTLSQSMDTAKDKPISFAQGFTKAASAVMALGQASSTVVGILDVFNDSEATTGDKIMALVSGIGMLIPAIMAIAPAFSTASVGAKLFGVTATEAGTAASLAMWQVTLIVAAITAIIAVIAFLVTQESKAEKQAKRSAKAAEEMKESADEAAESLNNIKNAFDTYDTAVAKLKECREGTEEWNKALQEVNSTVLKILQDVPELAANANLFVRDPSTGMLTINESEKANVLAAAEQKADITAALSVVANSIAAVDRMASTAKGLEEEIGNYKGVGQYNYDTDSYADYIELGKILTDNAADLAGLTETKYRDKVNELLKDVASDMAKSYSGFDQQINTLVDSAVSYQSQINTLATNTEAAAQQMRTAFQLLADQQLGSSVGGAEKSMASVELEKRTKELKNAYYDLMTSNANSDKAINAAAKVKYGGATGINAASNASNAIYKEIANRLAEATNNEYVAATGNTVLGTDNNRRFIFDKGGDRVEKSASWVAQQIAAAEALKELNKSANEAAHALNNMDKRIAKFSKGFVANETAESVMRGFIASQNFEGFSIGDLTAFQKEVAQFNPDGIATGNASKADIGWYLDRLFGDGKDGTIDDITAEKYNFKNTQDMIDTFYNQLTAKYKLIESITIDEAGLINFDKLSEKAAVAFDNAYKKMNLGPLGEKAGETFVNGINDILNIKKLDPDKQVEALEKLSEIDWSASDSLEKVQAIMATFNVDLDISQWKEFADTMRIAYNATPDYSKIKTELTSIGAILADLEFGSIIKEEDFEVLAKYSDEWQDFFMLQTDGTRKFIGNVESMKRVTQEAIRENGKSLLENEKYAKAIKDTGIKTNFTEADVEMAAGGDGKDGLFRFAAEDKSTAILKELGWNVSEDGRIWKKSPGNRGNEQTISQEEASRRVMNYQRANMASDLINTPEVKEVLQHQGYTQETLDEIIKEARQGNRERLDVLMSGLDSLVGQDYEKLNIEYEQMLASTADSFGELKQMLDDSEISLDTYKRGVLSLFQEQSAAATSVNELEQAWSAALATGVQLDYGIYADSLLRLSEQYSICADEANAFSIALQSNNEEVRENAEENLEATIMLGEAAQRYGFSAEELSVQSKQIAKEYGLNGKEAARLTIQNQRMNKGIEDLVNNWEEWSEELHNNDKASRDWSKAAVNTTKAIANLVGASESLELPNDFFDSAKNMRLISEAANGSAKAINELGVIVANAQIQMMAFQEGMTDISGNLINEEQFNLWKKIAVDGITELQNSLDELKVGDNIYEKLGGDDWVNALNKMAEATGMSVEEMNSLLNSMGVDAEVVTDYATQTTMVPEYETFTSDPVPAEEGGVKQTSYTRIKDYKPVEGKVPVAKINVGKEVGSEKPKITYLGNGSVSKSSTSSKGSSKKTSEARQKKSDMVDRYKEIEDTLDDTRKKMDDASKAADRLWGPSRLAQMKQVNQALKEEVDQLKNKKEEVDQYLTLDKASLNSAATDLGLTFSYDNMGNISNYEAQMSALYEAREKMLDRFGKNISDSEQEQLDDFDKKIETLKTAISQYDETRELSEDLSSEIQDKFYEWQDNNYEQLTYKLELQVEINDRDLEALEYYLSKTEDDFYKQAEGIGYLTQQFGIYNDKLEDNQNHLANLQQEYKDENISQPNYIKGLKEIFSATIANAQALADLDKQTLEYYGNTLNMANEEISKYTDRMEHQASVLEHFKNIMDMIGESINYEALGVILEGQAQTIENELKVAQETYDFYSSEATKKKHLMDYAIASGDMEAAELYRKEWEAAEAAAREAQDNMLSKTEEWAEAMKAVLENNLAGLAQTLENALTGGTSFDTITTQMERATSLQEEYLTSTNRIYETNKLINTAQKEIDKTTNTVAKKRLKSFQEEIAQLQNKSKLSQYELDIQQAKYELLLAEIALEESQQAKSTVRLQRDSEGNFGYVYTADANAVADAEQKLADAQNNLYNIGLDGANDYSQKYVQIMQEMHETFSELQQQYLNGEFETEEDYHRAMEDAKAYYFQKLQDYSNLYQVALTTDSRVIADAWSTDFDIMTTKTEDWKKAVNGYLDEVNKAFEGWEKVVERVKTETVGQDLDVLKDKTQAIVDVSVDLSEQITKEGGVIDSIEAEMTAVNAITSTYAQWRKEIAATIAENEKLMRQTKMIIDEQADGKSSADSEDSNPKTDNKDKSSATTDTTGASGNNNTNSKQPSLVDGSKVTVKKTARHFSRDGGNGTKMQGWVPGHTFTVIDIDGNEVLIGKGNSYSQATGWVRKTDLEGFKTGGYTGAWGSEGKLAMLHQKEIVLNADDTANFLASLEVLREIVNTINLHSLSVQLGGLLSSPGYINTNNSQMLEQQVHIEASFPGVTERNEIEEAFNNLINRAAQYINRS